MPVLYDGRAYIARNHALDTAAHRRRVLVALETARIGPAIILMADTQTAPIKTLHSDAMIAFRVSFLTDQRIWPELSDWETPTYYRERMFVLQGRTVLLEVEGGRPRTTTHDTREPALKATDDDLRRICGANEHP